MSTATEHPQASSDHHRRQPPRITERDSTAAAAFTMFDSDGELYADPRGRSITMPSILKVAATVEVRRGSPLVTVDPPHLQVTGAVVAERLARSGLSDLEVRVRIQTQGRPATDHNGVAAAAAVIAFERALALPPDRRWLRRRFAGGGIAIEPLIRGQTLLWDSQGARPISDRFELPPGAYVSFTSGRTSPPTPIPGARGGAQLPANALRTLVGALVRGDLETVARVSSCSLEFACRAHSLYEMDVLRTIRRSGLALGYYGSHICGDTFGLIGHPDTFDALFTELVGALPPGCKARGFVRQPDLPLRLTPWREATT